jgi:hypothetical protein
MKNRHAPKIMKMAPRFVAASSLRGCRKPIGIGEKAVSGEKKAALSAWHRGGGSAGVACRKIWHGVAPESRGGGDGAGGALAAA